MTDNHTKTPWGYDGEDSVASQDWGADGWSVFPVNKEGNCIGWIADVNCEEDAQRIVKCVNEFDEVVEALEDAIRDLGDITRHWGTEGSKEQAGALEEDLKQALAKAKK